MIIRRIAITLIFILLVFSVFLISRKQQPTEIGFNVCSLTILGPSCEKPLHNIGMSTTSSNIYKFFWITIGDTTFRLCIKMPF